MIDWLRFQTKRSDAPRISPAQLMTPGPQMRPEQLELMRASFKDWDVEKILLGGKEPQITQDQNGNTSLYDARLIAQALFDSDSFREVQAQYSPNVVVGRAQLGGLTVGTILFETRTTTVVRPADPARGLTEDQRTMRRAGRVWDEHGAHKTADWINTINWEGHPMVMIPNIRGFKGDTSALYDEVMKHGAQIVRNLRYFKQPFIIWMPPYSELRGGAWVVIDPNINREQITFLVDERATLGVLEPEMMFPLPSVSRSVVADARVFGDDIARKKWLRLLMLSDAPEVAVRQGNLHGVVPLKDVRRHIFEAILAGIKANNQ